MGSFPDPLTRSAGSGPALLRPIVVREPKVLAWATRVRRLEKSARAIFPPSLEKFFYLHAARARPLLTHHGFLSTPPLLTIAVRFAEVTP